MSGNSLAKSLVQKAEIQNHELALRRAAVVVTASLPPDLDEALRVLELARGLVTDFLSRPPGLRGL